MSYVQLLQVIAARLLQQYLSPRYLQPRGVRRRKPVSPVESDAHEPS